MLVVVSCLYLKMSLMGALVVDLQLRHAWPFVEGYNRYQLGPWGLRTLGQFVLSSKEESLACASCVHRLYLLHRDYHFHVNKIGETVSIKL